MRIKLGRELAGVFERDDSDGVARTEIDKGRRHLAPISKLERPLAQPATGHETDGVRGTAIDLYIGDETLAVCAVRIGDAQPGQAEQSHAHTENLSRAQVTVRGFSLP